MAALSLVLGAGAVHGVTAERLVDLQSGPERQSTSPANFRTVGDVIFFTATDDDQFSLWRTDGTPGGTYPFRDLPRREMTFLADDGERLFFLHQRIFGPTDLWVTDGTEEGTVRLTDGPSVPDELYRLDPAEWLDDAGRLVFEARTESGKEQIWVSDGTPQGTGLVADPLGENEGSVGDVVGSESVAYFGVRPRRSGFNALWRTDGTVGGTFPLDVGDSVSELSYRMFDDALLAVTTSRESRRSALWIVHPGSVTPELLADGILVPDEDDDWEVFWRLDIGHRVVFSVFAGTSAGGVPTGGETSRTELWSTDGTVAGTMRFPDGERIPVVRSGPDSAPVVVDDEAYFVGRDRAHGEELWVTDGRVGGTRRVTDLCPGRCDGVEPTLLQRIGELLVVSGTDGRRGVEPWIVPLGETNRPRLLADICPGECGSRPLWAYAVGRSVIFGLGIDCVGCMGFAQVWASDLTANGTRPVGRFPTVGLLIEPGRANQVERLGERLVLPVGDAVEADPWVVQAAPAVCGSAGPALCFDGGDVEVRVDWQLSDGRSGAGQPVPLTPKSGYFWFFDRDNVELLVKLLDGCGVTGRRWFFAAGLTDVELEIVVRDLSTFETRRYPNSAGSPLQPVLDTAALSCRR